MALTPGLLLAERYRLTRRLAVGGMGEVWTAEDTRLARQVAVKILKSELTSDPEFVDRFRAEARITASLNHPGIAAVHDYGEVASIAGGPRDTAYLVMELVSGEPLEEVADSFAALREAVGRIVDWQPPYLVFKACFGATLACNAGPHQTDRGIADVATGKVMESPILEVLEA